MRYILTLVFLAINIFAYDAFISVDKLKENLDNEKLIVLDVNSKADYEKSHIIGALHVEIKDFIDNKSSIDEVSFAKRLQKAFTNLGINDDSAVVIYSRSNDADLLNSSYLAFTFIQNGFNNVSILNGGYMAWVFKYNRLVSSEYPEDIEDGNYKIITDNTFFVDTDFIKDNLNKIQLIDSRESPYYFGTKKSLEIKNFGHIPNAKSSFYKDKFLNDFSLRSDDEIDTIFIKGLEITKARDIVVYADDKLSAIMNWYILYQKLGFVNTKIYEASFSEWGNLELPTVLFKWE